MAHRPKNDRSIAGSAHATPTNSDATSAIKSVRSARDKPSISIASNGAAKRCASNASSRSLAWPFRYPNNRTLSACGSVGKARRFVLDHASQPSPGPLQGTRRPHSYVEAVLIMRCKPGPTHRACGQVGPLLCIFLNSAYTMSCSRQSTARRCCLGKSGATWALYSTNSPGARNAGSRKDT